MYAWNQIQFFNSTQRFLNLKKNVPKLKSQGVKIGEIGLKPTVGEPPNKFEVPSLGLKVLF
jgi:hypothetical protein